MKGCFENEPSSSSSSSVCVTTASFWPAVHSSSFVSEVDRVHGVKENDALIEDAGDQSCSTPSTSGAGWSKPRVLLLAVLFLATYLLLPLVCSRDGAMVISCCSSSEGWPPSPGADDARTHDDSGDSFQEVWRKAATADSPSDEARGANRVRFPRTKRRLPQCIIIGVRKCGTRALLEFLNVHPHMVKATQEVHFFDDDSRYSLGLEWYRRKMPYSFADQITVEKSPSYFVTPNVPQRIYAMNRAARLLLIVRDPVTRAVSDYTQIHANRLSKGKRHDASFESLALARDGSVNADYKALQISLYAEHLRPWLRVFPRRQVHVVDGDRLVTDPFPELRRIEDFLGLEHRITRDNFYFNKTKGFYCVRNETADKCLSEAKGRKHPPVSERAVDKLRRFFAPHNERFFAMIGQNFTWRPGGTRHSFDPTRSLEIEW